MDINHKDHTQSTSGDNADARDTRKVFQRWSGKRGKPPALEMKRLLNLKTKAGRIVRWFLDEGPQLVKTMAKEFEISYGSAFCYLLLLNRDYGIGYTLTDGLADLIIPAGTPNPFAEHRSQLPRTGPPKGSEFGKKHGAHKLKLQLENLGTAGISKNTALGKELARRRQALQADAGGEDLTQLKLDLIEKYQRTELLIETIDVWLFQQPSLINKKNKTLHPVINERNRLVELSVRLAETIGIERRQKALDLKSYLQSKTSTDETRNERQEQG
jgi:hypothetical protein